VADRQADVAVPAASPAILTGDRAAVGPDIEAWFAVWTRSRHENSVLAQLVAKDIEVFLPTITRWSRWKDRRKRIDWPLFPGYCFVRIPSADSRAVLKCAGVVGLVSFEGRPAAISDWEIESIRALVSSELRYDPCPLIREGMSVEVVSGPLRGVVGKLVRKGSHARLVLAVDLIGQAVSVEIDAADVRPY
jgi:transcription termination/antitermination protein NusG